MPPDELKPLLLQTHRGERDAAVRLYRLTAPRLLAYARGLARPDAAEDAVQQAFLRILSLDARTIETVVDVLPWLLRLVRNALFNDARAASRRRARETGWAPAAAAIRRPAADDDLLTALSHIDPDARELVLLKHVAGLTFDQMAFALDTNRNTLASRYRSALESLRSQLPSQVAHG